MRQVKPGYIHIRINGGRQRDDSKTTNQAVRHRINQELKFLYKKKQHINQTLYGIHLDCSHQFNGMWQYIQCNIDEGLSTNMNTIYTKLNKKLDNHIHHTRREQRNIDKTTINHNRVINLSKVTFTKEQLKTLNLGPQFAIEKDPKYYINELIIYTDNAIRHLNSSVQNAVTYLATNKIQQIKESNRQNIIHKRLQYNIK